MRELRVKLQRFVVIIPAYGVQLSAFGIVFGFWPAAQRQSTFVVAFTWLTLPFMSMFALHFLLPKAKPTSTTPVDSSSSANNNNNNANAGIHGRPTRTPTRAVPPPTTTTTTTTTIAALASPS